MEQKNGNKILMGIPEIKRPQETPWHRWEDNLKEIIWDGLHCIHLVLDRDK